MLGLINEQAANTDSNERMMMYDLWKLLQGEVKEEVAVEDARLIISAILRMNHHKRIGVE